MERDGRLLCINPEWQEVAVWDPYQVRGRGMPDGWMTLDDFAERLWLAHERGDIIGSATFDDALKGTDDDVELSPVTKGQNLDT